VRVQQAIVEMSVTGGGDAVSVTPTSGGIVQELYNCVVNALHKITTNNIRKVAAQI
jgi:hypothetical protein